MALRASNREYFISDTQTLGFGLRRAALLALVVLVACSGGESSSARRESTSTSQGSSAIAAQVLSALRAFPPFATVGDTPPTEPREASWQLSPITVSAPRTADAALEVTTSDGAFALKVRPLDVRSVPMHSQGAISVAPDARVDTDLVYVVEPDRVEELRLLRSPKAPSSARYRLELSDEGEVRARGDQVDVVSAAGQVRLTSEPMFAVDARGERRALSARSTQLGARTFELIVNLDVSGLTHPIAVDPTWTVTGSMITARMSHSLTLLQDGRVLAAGGQKWNAALSRYAPVRNVEIYDPVQSAWTAVALMNGSRYGHDAVLLADGRVLVGAPSYAGAPPGEVYNPTQNTWTQTGPYPATGAWRHVLLDSGLVLGVGTQTCGLYDSATNAWVDIGDTLENHFGHTLTLLQDGTVLVAGGNTATTEIYDPVAGTFTLVGQMQAARRDHNAAMLANGKVLVAGGVTGTSAVSSAELYDPVSKTWTAVAPMLTKRNGHTATWVSSGHLGKVLIAGGASSSPISETAYGHATSELYDPVTDSWSTFTGPASRPIEPEAVRLQDGRVLLCGGRSGSSTELNKAEVLALQEPNGTRCAVAGDCASGFCTDGVCCDSACAGTCQACTAALKQSGVGDGICGAAKLGTDPHANCSAQSAASCGRDGECDGLGGCRLHAAGTACGGTVCNGNQVSGQVCNGAGACVTSGGTDCSPYLCAGGTCTSPCTTEQHCAIGHFCDAGTCRVKLANGLSCSLANACTSGYCVDGVCCGSACTGSCQACTTALKGAGSDGECGPVAAGLDPDSDCSTQSASSCGTDGACNGSGGCRLYAQGTECGTPQCVGTVLTPSSCDGLGACSIESSGTDCAPHRCNAGLCTDPCGVDGDCVAGYFCSQGDCTAKLVPGASCTAANQCSSGFCVDNVCCDRVCGGACEACSMQKKGQGGDGECGFIATGSDPDGECSAEPAAVCGRDGQCNGAGACRLHQPGTSCGATTCNGNFVTGQICNGMGVCQLESGGADCSPYVCAGSGCRIPCTQESDCVVGNFCDAGTCKAKRANGAQCLAALECASGFCVDGLCCDTRCDGACQACAANTKQSGSGDGTCGNAASGTDPHDDCVDDGAPSCDRDGTCDGSGACRRYASGTACGAAQCVSDGAQGFQVNAFACDGAGTCGAQVADSCGEFACDNAGCRSDCATDEHCAGDNYCEDAACVGKLNDGTSCGEARQCQSGFCVDGVCCDRACSGQCEACDASGAEGRCTPVVGLPHGTRPACAAASGSDPCGAAICDGTLGTNCAGFVYDVPCRDASCQQGKATLPASCNGKGVCPAAQEAECGRFACSGQACGSSCTAEADCAPGFRCQNSDCIPADVSVCQDDLTERAPDGTTHDCTPFQCVVGRCLTECTASTDCAPGHVCDTATRACVAVQAAPAEDDSGCGCRLPGRSRDGSPMAALVLALLLGVGARRRARC